MGTNQVCPPVVYKARRNRPARPQQAWHTEQIWVLGHLGMVAAIHIATGWTSTDTHLWMRCCEEGVKAERLRGHSRPAAASGHALRSPETEHGPCMLQALVHRLGTLYLASTPQHSFRHVVVSEAKWQLGQHRALLASSPKWLSRLPDTCAPYPCSWMASSLCHGSPQQDEQNAAVPQPGQILRPFSGTRTRTRHASTTLEA